MPELFKAIETAPVGFRVNFRPGMEGAQVDRMAGEAGKLWGVQVIRRGEAKGHGAWVDSAFLDQVVESGRGEKAIKVRFTHPGMSSDGLGRLLGRMHNFRRDGDVVRGDLSFVKSATDTPSGNLARYVMDLAEETPDMVGMSIVFRRDEQAEGDFRKANKQDNQFVSPDPENESNFPHMRLSKLMAVDVVDEPAATEGMFAWGGDELAKAEGVLLYSLGVQQECPDGEWAIHPERLRRFCADVFERHHITLQTPVASGVDDAMGASNKDEPKGSNEMDISELTVKQLTEKRPDIVQELRAETEEAHTKALAEKDEQHKEDLAASVETERERCLHIAKEGREFAQFDIAEKCIAEGTEQYEAVAQISKAALAAQREAKGPGPNTGSEGATGNDATSSKYEAEGVDKRSAKVAAKADELRAANPSKSHFDAMLEADKLIPA